MSSSAKWFQQRRQVHSNPASSIRPSTGQSTIHFGKAPKGGDQFAAHAARMKAEQESKVAKAAVSLSKGQAAAVERVLQKKSVFITGSAGCGKSHVLKALIQQLPKATT
eukprot:gene3566-28184_t